MKPIVRVLLSISDPGRHLKLQLKSLLDQEGVAIDLLFHLDDGCESSEPIVRSYFPTARRAKLQAHLGVPTAYLKLLDQTTAGAQYWSFADQDDIWAPHKLLNAVQWLQGRGGPALWIGSAQTLGRSGLGGRNERVLPTPDFKPGFGNALVQTIAPGCTMVWNSRLQQLVSQPIDPRAVRMHDAWVYLIAASFGTIHVERDIQMLYRIHSGNAIGLKQSFWSRSRRIAERRRIQTNTVRTQADHLIKVFGAQLDHEQMRLAHLVAEGNAWDLTLASASRKLVRNRALEQLLLPLWIKSHHSPREIQA